MSRFCSLAPCRFFALSTIALSKPISMFALCVLFFGAFFSAQTAQAQYGIFKDFRCSNIAYCFYPVEKEFQVDAITNGKKTPLVFKPGQVVNFRRTLLGYYELTTQTKDGKSWREGKVSLTASEVQEHFGAPVESTTGREFTPNLVAPMRLVGRGMKLASTPQAVADMGPGQMSYFGAEAFAKPTTVEATGTRLVNTGTNENPNWISTQQVCFENSYFGQKHCGWVRADQLRLQGKNAPNPFMTAEKRRPGAPAAAASGMPKDYPCTHPSGLANNTFSRLKEVAGVLARSADKERTAREHMMDHIGSCAFWPPQLPAEKVEALIRPLDGKNMNLYDGIIREKVIQEWKRITPPKSHELDAIRVRSGGKSRPLTRLDFLKIDVLARTIYGESRNCANEPGHLEATARTMINRANKKLPRLFERPGYFKVKDKSGKFSEVAQGFKEIDPLYHVTLSDRQYSVWNNANEVGGDLKAHLNNSRGSFCPAITSKGTTDSDAWARSVSVAMSAVLDPDVFMKDTDAFKNLYFYTSPAAQYKDRNAWQKLPTPSYNGKPLNEKRCMVFFADKTNASKYR